MKNFYITLVLSLFVMYSWSQEYKRMISTGTYTVQQIQASAEAHFDIVGRGRGLGYKQYKRWEYQALRNMDDNGMLKTPEFYYNELQNYNGYLNQSNVLARTTVGTWEELGPTYWNATSGYNPGVGRVTSIAFENGNTDHMIVGARTGGVWKTTDGGTNWQVLTDNLSNLVVWSLAIDPTNSQTYFWGSSSGTIFKSTDAGATWNILADIGNGSVNKILIDPNNTQKMYCSAENGGIYKSTNAGVNWTRIHASATNGFDIEFKPGDTNVIYASGNQFFKSIDGGATFNVPNSLPLWTQEYVSGTTDWSTASVNENGSVTPKTGNSMAILFIDSPSNPITKLVSPELNLSGASNPQLKFSYTQVNWFGDLDQLKVYYKTSLNGTWLELADYSNEITTWTDITLNLPNPSSTYYIAFEGLNHYGRGTTLDDVSVEDTTLGTLFQDGFESTPNAFGSGAKMMGVSADDDSVIYVVEESGGTYGGLHKSTDSGETFTKFNHGNDNYFGYESAADDARGQAPRDMDVAVNPNDADDVHIAGINTWRSTDGGANFNITSQWTPDDAAFENIGYCHADVDFLEYLDGKLYAATDGGVYVANNPLNVNSNYYTDLTSGLGIRQFYRIGISQTNPSIVTGGSQDNGTSIMDTNGDWTDWYGADGMESFIDKNNSNIIYGTAQNGWLVKSFDSGQNVSVITPLDNLGEPKSGNWITPFEQDPILQNVIYAGYTQVNKSIDGGNTWSVISQNFGNNLDELKIAPSNNSVMYASVGGNLYRTTNGGLTNWTNLSPSNPAISTDYAGFINYIAVHPTNPNKLAIATTSSSKVYVSSDAGNTWAPYRFNLPNFSARALAWHDNGNDGLYLGMNYGVFYIDNTTNNTWQPFSNNLPNVSINELEINTVTNQIYAGTYGRGLWRSNVYDSSLSVNEFELNSLVLYPNPASKEINLSWNKSEQVSIRIYNAIGKLMYFVKNKSLINTMSVDISNYASGLYFVKINNINGVITKKLIID